MEAERLPRAMLKAMGIKERTGAQTLRSNRETWAQRGQAIFAGCTAVQKAAPEQGSFQLCETGIERWDILNLTSMSHMPLVQKAA